MGVTRGDRTGRDSLGRRHILHPGLKGLQRERKSLTDRGGTDFTAEFARCELFVNIHSRLRSPAALLLRRYRRCRAGWPQPPPSRPRGPRRAPARPRQSPGNRGSPASRAHDLCREFSLPAPAGSYPSSSAPGFLFNPLIPPLSTYPPAPYPPPSIQLFTFCPPLFLLLFF